MQVVNGDIFCCRWNFTDVFLSWWEYNITLRTRNCKSSRVILADFYNGTHTKISIQHLIKIQNKINITDCLRCLKIMMHVIYSYIILSDITNMNWENHVKIEKERESEAKSGIREGKWDQLCLSHHHIKRVPIGGRSVNMWYDSWKPSKLKKLTKQ